MQQLRKDMFRYNLKNFNYIPSFFTINLPFGSKFKLLILSFMGWGKEKIDVFSIIYLPKCFHMYTVGIGTVWKIYIFIYKYYIHKSLNTIKTK